jgi:thiamine biosynthesis lipoprotein
VVADSCAEADAWATALMVLGAAEGEALAQRLGLRAYFVRKLGAGGFEESSVR